MSKKELAQKYGISATTLSKLMNKEYYPELKKKGYQKTQQLLSPAVVRCFIEMHGEPLNNDEL